MIKICCDINQDLGEGLGSRIQCHLASKLICAHLGFEYLETPISNLAHNYDGVDDTEFCKQYNDYFKIKQGGWPSLPIIDIRAFSTEELLSLAIDENVIYKINMLSGKKILDADEKILNAKRSIGKEPTNNRVAIHLRVINQSDVDFSDCRQYYVQGNFVEDRILRLIDEIGGDIDIYTQSGYTDSSKSNRVDFSNLLRLSNVTMHIDCGVTELIQGCVDAGTYIMSNSSLSYICYLLRKGPTMATRSFWHTLDKNVRYY
tara:strand:+ start:3057 stop:3836 length:780 start_codon:yes stop_codon:yes gene_type:complete